MQKIIPFKKDIIFETNVSEIVSISLEHELNNDKNDIHGMFTVSGKYKLADTSINVEEFSYNLPFDIKVDERYDTSQMKIDVDDFYYEIVNNNILSVNIDVLIDKLEEKELEDSMDILEENNLREENLEVQNDKLDTVSDETLEDVTLEKTRCIEEENDDILFDRDKKAFNSIFDEIDDTKETYQSYHVYIVREGDSLESIMQKYNVTKEDLELYNNLSELKINDKIIIPTNNAES